MIKFLLDANLSPKTSKYLTKLGFDSKSITEEKLGYLKDSEIIKITKKEKRIIITFDLDFGEIYHQKESGNMGIIVLRLENQTPENVNSILDQFLSKETDKLKQNIKSLIVIKKGSTRFVK
ncbi:MAG: hypothetical protein ACD_19C00014G0009 [uncultured bacterium]|nr:MAG: hypothetical protein ACD_19C00014G0009 [uncultured bacterium]